MVTFGVDVGVKNCTRVLSKQGPEYVLTQAAWLPLWLLTVVESKRKWRGFTWNPFKCRSRFFCYYFVICELYFLLFLYMSFQDRKYYPKTFLH